MAPKIVLTGATGFIGPHVQRALIAAGFRVVALVRPDSRNGDRIVHGAEVEQVALTDRAALEVLLADAAFGIYCAGAVRGRSAGDFHPANVAGVECFAEAARRSMKVPKVLLMSSLAATRPHLSAYAASKAAGEAVLQNKQNLAWVILRPPAVYGPGDREMMPLLSSIRHGLAVIVGPPGQRLSLLHVFDLAAAVLSVVTGFDSCRGMVFEIDDGRPRGYGWSDIIEQTRGRMPVLRLRVPHGLLTLFGTLNLKFASSLHYLPMLTPGKVRELSEPSWLCNNQALAAATGWAPRIKLRDGVQDLFSQS